MRGRKTNKKKLFENYFSFAISNIINSKCFLLATLRLLVLVVRWVHHHLYDMNHIFCYGFFSFFFLPLSIIFDDFLRMSAHRPLHKDVCSFDEELLKKKAIIKSLNAIFSTLALLVYLLAE